MANLYFAQPGDTSLSRRAGKGELFRIRKGVYTDTADPSQQAQALVQGWMDVACYLFPGAVLVDRSAAELKPVNGRVWLKLASINKNNNVKVGQLVFSLSGGNTSDGVEQVVPELQRSNPARNLLENLTPSRLTGGIRRTLGREWVESELLNIIRLRGEDALNAIRDEARRLASALDLQNEFTQLNAIISALLQTRPTEGVLQTRAGVASANGEPFDQVRIELFETCADYLQQLELAPLSFHYDKAAWRNLTFFESYFSNYIEGTQFTLEEAEAIVFERKPNYQRHADSHDVISHVELAGDMTEMCRLPQAAVELIDILKTRHQLLMAARPDKRPGEFKQRSNKAGASTFVEPELVEGTLVQGFEVYKALPPGLLRALFIHFLVSECHPFDDGNGRLARIMMNAELVAQDQHKIIVPVVHRENYLNGLRLATRETRFRTMVKVLHQMQCYSASFDWRDYGEVKSILQAHAADREPDQGITVFNKVIAQLGGVYPVDPV